MRDDDYDYFGACEAPTDLMRRNECLTSLCCDKSAGLMSKMALGHFAVQARVRDQAREALLRLDAHQKENR